MSHENVSENGQQTYTIVPIEGKEVIQKNFAFYGQDGEQAAAEFVETKKLTLARRFQLMERGFMLKLKEENGRKTMFDEVGVQISLGNNKKITK